ncbi:unnamed protein product, partial [Closterium sp. NIES-53]
MIHSMQAKVRRELVAEEQEIQAMPDRPYRSFLRWAHRQRAEIAKSHAVMRRAARDRLLKAVFAARRQILADRQLAARDGRAARNRHVVRFHEQAAREAARRREEERQKRVEMLLKSNDMDAYRAMLEEEKEKAGVGKGAKERFEMLSSFLSQTEEYLRKLGGKICAAKSVQEVEEAAVAAAAEAREKGMSEEEVEAYVQRVVASLSRNDGPEGDEVGGETGAAAVSKYYKLAHSVSETITHQPSMLRMGTLREYQMVGLQWMVSLYNNRLNGILADEMGLGKTVQVMALLAYLMEHKSNYGPHLIIVPNAVLVNWKAELHAWLPSLSAVFYVGGKDQRAKLYTK